MGWYGNTCTALIHRISNKMSGCPSSCNWCGVLFFVILTNVSISVSAGFATNYGVFKHLVHEITNTTTQSFNFSTKCPISEINDCHTVPVHFNIEHTLVLPGGRSAEGARPGISTSRVTSADGTPYLVRINEFQYNCSRIVIDYSMANIVHMNRSGYFNSETMRKLVYVPALPWQYAPAATKTRDVRVLVTFSRVLDDRRSHLVQSLRQEGIDVKWVTGLHASGHDMRSVLDHTRILLNVHQTPHHHTLEEFRVLPALSRGVVIVSEAIPLSDAIPYASQLIFTDYNNLIATVKKIDSNYDDEYDRLHGAGSITASILSRMYVKARRDLASRLSKVLQPCNLE